VRIKIPSLLLASFLLASTAHSQSRMVYEGVADLKLKPIGTLILLEINGSHVSGWIRLGKFVPIDGGTISEDSTEFRAGGNSYKLDEKKGRIAYSGPDGNGESRLIRLTPIAGHFDELTEGEGFSDSDSHLITMKVDARMRRFHEEGPSLWKREGPPFERFTRMEEMLQRDITVWVAELSDFGGDIEVVEEPEGLNIQLKLPKKAKEKKKK
jgi:hypothetical protein